MKRIVLFLILLLSNKIYACSPLAFDFEYWLNHASSINIGIVTSISIPDIEASYLGTPEEEDERIMIPYRYIFRAVNVKNIKGNSAKLYYFNPGCAFSSEMIGKDIIIFESSNGKNFIESTKENLEKIKHALKI